MCIRELPFLALWLVETQLVTIGCAITVPRMQNYCSLDVEFLFHGCVISSWKCFGWNTKHFFGFSLKTSICMKKTEGFQRKTRFECTLPLMLWPQTIHFEEEKIEGSKKSRLFQIIAILWPLLFFSSAQKIFDSYLKICLIHILNQRVASPV